MREASHPSSLISTNQSEDDHAIISKTTIDDSSINESELQKTSTEIESVIISHRKEIFDLLFVVF